MAKSARAVAPDEVLERRQVLLEEAYRQGMVVEKPKQGYVAWCDMLEEALIESFCRGASVRTACAQAGCCTSTFYEHFRKPGEFRERVIQARQSLIGTVEENLVLACILPDNHGRRDIQAMKFFLTNRAPDRYKDRVDHLHHIDDLGVAESSGESQREFTPESRKAAKALARQLLLGEPADADLVEEAASALAEEPDTEEEPPY